MSIIVIEPITPVVGKKYYAKIAGVVQESNPRALVAATVYAIGLQTITLDVFVDGRKRNTYFRGDVQFIEEVAPQPEKV